jgi:menaquinone-dependent protoporphyrinogen IX oxidase
MNSVVVYKSKTGFTKKYAQWISQELGCDMMEVSKANAESLKSYGVAIYGGGITAGQIGGLKKFKELMASLKDKKMIAFATGATPAGEVKAMQQIKETNFTAQEQQTIPYFYFQSGINYENMSVGGKLLMKMFTAMLSNKKDKTPEEQGMADSIKQSCDLTKKEYIQPLVECVKSM